MRRPTERTARRALAAVALCLAFPSVSASAKCGSGNRPSYDDVEAIMLKQNGCGANIGSFSASPAPRQLRKTFECSTYWAFFWKGGPANFPTQYSQYNLHGAVGTYRLLATTADAVDILRKDNFFALSPADGYVTDTAQTVLSVRRCAVITTIATFTGAGNLEPATAKLLTDLAALVKLSAKTRVSTVPRSFDETGLFEPLPL